MTGGDGRGGGPHGDERGGDLHGGEGAGVPAAAAGASPPPGPACPDCHHTREHLAGCALAALPVRDAAALGHDAALEFLRARADGDYPLAPPAPAPPLHRLRPPPTAPACPACHHTHTHAPGCPLTPLPVADAAALGHDTALAQVRARDTGYGAPPPPAPACPACHHTHTHAPGCPLTPLPVADAAALGHGGEGFGPQPGSAPPPADACPACHHTRRHQRGCVLEPLPVRDAAVLGYDAALDRVHALRAAPPATGAPPPADACPGCHHTRRHAPGCELAALTVAEAAVLGLRAARDLLRVRAADGTGTPPPAPRGIRGWLRRRRR
ncbi:hypothetical protein [Streptomyces griseoviridis]|uniref:Uncharacterized protein n=1 Tax=Streptomyces griseoviridis TaxID=45398 RepID=A0ABT9LJ86_STRGD|nr:hypothetical protein [Streptomyces griseoviridis]MDP9683755.1 hypothetical protein [Streptomyces griseoviridis]GGS92493.1 hypothetical protein GCM10010240_27320 [Streptomyces griseoviridis]